MYLSEIRSKDLDLIKLAQNQIQWRCWTLGDWVSQSIGQSVMVV